MMLRPTPKERPRSEWMGCKQDSIHNKRELKKGSLAAANEKTASARRPQVRGNILEQQAWKQWSATSVRSAAAKPATGCATSITAEMIKPVPCSSNYSNPQMTVLPVGITPRIAAKKYTFPGDRLAATSPHDTPSRAPTVSGRLPAGSHETLQKGTGWLLAQAHLVKASCCKTWPDLLVKNICAPLNWHSGSRVGHEDDEDNEEEGEEEEGEEEKKEGEVEEVGIDDDDEEHDEDDNNFEDDDGERKETVMALFQKPFWLQAGQAHPAM
eukprot:g46896.t1